MMKNYGPVMAAVTEFIVLLLGLTFIGHWIDTRYQLGAKCIFVGVFLGFGVGIFRLSRTLKKIMDQTDDEYKSDQKAGHEADRK